MTDGRFKLDHWTLRRAGVGLLVSVLAGPAVLAQYYPQQYPEAAKPAPAPPPEEQPAAQPAPERPLFEIMFTDIDKVGVGWESFLKLFRANAMMTSDELLASQRYARALGFCSRAMSTLEHYSPRSSAYNDRAAEKDLRRRLLVCELAQSTDHTLSAGDYDRVGDYALIREEPHSNADELQDRGADLDLLKVYVFVDRVYRDGDAPGDLVPRLVHDVGGYLFANVEYFVNTSADADVKKVGKQEVEEAAQKLMGDIADAIKTEKAPPVVVDDLSDYEKLAAME